jgi:hypothetical protein
VVATYVYPCAPTYSITRAGIGSWLFGRDVALGGSRYFDSRFAVDCVDADATRRAWPWRLMHDAADVDPVGIHSDGTAVTIRLTPSAIDADTLDAAISLAGELASLDHRDAVDRSRGPFRSLWTTAPTLGALPPATRISRPSRRPGTPTNLQHLEGL